MAVLMSPPTNHLLVGQPRGIGVVGSPDTPIYVADEIERRQLHGAFFAPMDWSDYIVWKQPSGFRPLAWSHVHLLTPEAWNDYQYISAGAPDWLARADAHGVRFLVISKQRQRQLAGSAMKYANQKDTRAAILYQDQKSLLVELRGA
jgi:hypothetical protein